MRKEYEKLVKQMKFLQIGLGTRLAVIVAAVALSVVFGGVAATFLTGEKAVLEQVSQELQRVHAAQSLLQQERLNRLESAAAVLDARGVYTRMLLDEAARLEEAERRPRRGAEEEDDGPTLSERLAAVLEEDRSRLELDAVFLYDVEGEVLAYAGSSDFAADALADALVEIAPEDPGAADAEVGRAVGLFGTTPGEVVLRPLTPEFERLGTLGVVLGLGSRALEINRLTGAQTALLAASPTGPATVGTTLSGGADGLISELRLQGQALGQVYDQGRTVEEVLINLGEEPWMVFLTPVRFEGDAPVAALVALKPYKERLRALTLVRGILLGLGALATVIGVVLTTAIGRASTAPLSRLAAASDRAAAGELNIETGQSGLFGQIAGNIQSIVDREHRRRGLQYFLTGAARHLPEPVQEEAAKPPAARQIALIMVEMRRYANPKIGYDPEEHMARYARDLRRMTGVVSHRHGSVETLLGHRVMIAFEGENCVWHALCAATEIILLLSTRENAFDEPSPPVVAMGGGPVATATMSWDGRTAIATAGLPVQQLESLVREATPGEIFLSKPIYDSLAAIFQQRGIEVRSQRGLVSPQPLFALAAETAAQLTGVNMPSDSRAVQETVDLDALAPGTMISDRFEILACMGTGPFGAVFKAADRNRSDYVVLKLLHARALAQPDARDRLRDALRRGRLLDDPHVCAVLDSGEALGSAYFTRPFVRAMSLRHVLSLGAVPVIEAFLISKQICVGLAVAHEQGVVHGHLRPENVLLQTTGEVRVVDFGISAALLFEVVQESYNAPETVGRQPLLEPRGDIYSFGAVMTEMLTGTAPPFGADDTVVRAQLREGSAEIPGPLEDLVAVCFAPADSRPSAQGLLQDFLALEG